MPGALKLQPFDLAALERDYYLRKPDLADPSQLVSFGTSGHRGSSLRGSFTESHILALAQAICDFRAVNGFDGPLYMGKDTHALSSPAQRTALEVLAANGVQVILQADSGVTPTPVISWHILGYNRGRGDHLADGIVITPSHNPPDDAGFKYDPPNGGPADLEVTSWVEARANELLRSDNAGVKRVPFAAALRAHTTREQDLMMPYVRDLGAVVDVQAIRDSGLELGVDPLGGASNPYWDAIAGVHGINVAVVNPAIDPSFSFVPVDHDGKIRTDPSSPQVMARLIGLKDRFRVAIAADADADRHGVVTRSAGHLNPNRYLAVAIRYLLANRPGWPAGAAVGKTVVTSGLVDRVVAALGRRVREVPVGFKWFVRGLYDGSLCFGGEESAGASFLRRDGTAWSTDKDGIILGLLAAEITARTGKDPGEQARQLEAEFGRSHYTRIDAPATAEQKARLKALSPKAVREISLAGDPITASLTTAPGNGAPIGGLKVTTANGWFAARPSGTEEIYKIYAESFVSADHLGALVSEARALVGAAIGH